MRRILHFAAFTFIVAGLISGSYATTKRPAAVAGAFYPADRSELKNMVEGHLANVKNTPEIDGRIIALIVPHAGLIYSGQIAAHSYKLLEGSNIDKLILCGPSHRYRFDGISVYGPNISWLTPLGTVKCNSKLGLGLIRSHDKIGFIPEAHTQEHSLEVQLPYIQTVLDNFAIVPTTIGRQSAENIRILADGLAGLDLDSTTIMVASSDWQHYLPAAEGWKMDSIGLECLRKLDIDILGKYLDDGTVQACGGGAILAVMKAAVAKGADQVKILKYGDSGDITGDKSSVVSYVAAVIYNSSDKPRKSRAPESESSIEDKELPAKFELSDGEKKELLNIARKTLESYLANGSVPEFEVSDDLKKYGAAFVTLEENEHLRGCIGHTTAVEPLYKTVSTCAVQAAVADPRFPPVTANELDNIHIEISVLTPMQKVESFDEIKVGRDGLMIFKGNNRGLLLPQVAVEYSWDKTRFLEQTCLKAGLPANAYSTPDAVVYKFQAVIFSE